METPAESVFLLIDMWKLLCARLPAGRTTHANGVATMLGNVPLPFMNLCTHDSAMTDRDDVRRRLELAADRAARCPFPWMFALCEEWAPTDWETPVTDAGMAPTMMLYGMGTDRLEAPRHSLPSLDYRLVQDEATAQDLAEVNMHAYELPRDMIDCICNLSIWTGDSQGWVGYLDGRAVTTSATFPVGGTIYVGYVATLPTHFGKGYAEAVMRHSIVEGGKLSGFSRTTLHGTEAGRRLYEAMGYRTSAHFRLLTRAHE